MALLIQKDAVMERWESGPFSCGPLGSGDTMGAGGGVGPGPEKVIHPDPSDEGQVEQAGAAKQMRCLPSLLILGTTG